MASGYSVCLSDCGLPSRYNPPSPRNTAPLPKFTCGILINMQIIHGRGHCITCVIFRSCFKFYSVPDSMSLLDCICCPKHKYRTAAATDDLIVVSVETYGDLLNKASCLARFLRQKFETIDAHARTPPAVPCPDPAAGLELRMPRVVAVWAAGSPEAVCGMLAVMSIPAVFMPMPTAAVPTSDHPHMHTGIKLIIIRHNLAPPLYGGGADTAIKSSSHAVLKCGYELIQAQ